MKKSLLSTALVLLIPAAIVAQEAPRYSLSGSATAGYQLTNNPASSKFNEYRDLNDGVNNLNFGLDWNDSETGRYFETDAWNLGQDDHNIRVNAGKYGRYKLGLEWDEIPHLLLKGGKTPYTLSGNLLSVDSKVTLTTPAGQPTAPQQLVNDQDVATYLATPGVMKDVDVGNYRKKGSAGFSYAPVENLSFQLGYSNENRDGSKVTYGPIGDRPPRSTNVEFMEPIDYLSQEFTFATDYNADWFQVNASYNLSKFENHNDVLQWQNMYTGGAAAGSATDTWAGSRAVGIVGARALSPDNLAHNVLLTAGADLPMESRLTVTGGYSKLKQDEALIAYSTVDTVDAVANNVNAGDGLAWNNRDKLPRQTAQAEIDVKMFNASYSISPIQSLHLRPFARYYDLDNKTPSSNWRYVTNDTTAGANGTVDYRSFRKNEADEYSKKNFGLDGSYSLGFWRSTLGFGYQRENIDRHFREANTGENIFKGSWRTRPLDWLSFRTKYQYGDRDADTYNGNIRQESYWYTPGQATGGASKDNPQFTFYNHPDTRRYDVTDRKQHLVDVMTHMTALETLDIGFSFRYQNADYDSNVTATQPLLNMPGSNLSSGSTQNQDDRDTKTPGQQLGLLKNIQQRYGLDFSYPVGNSLTLTAFGMRQNGRSQQRGMEYDENKKETPTSGAVTPNGTNLPTWSQLDGLWFAETREITNTVGFGASFVVVPELLTFSTDHTYSQGKIDIDYTGWATNFADTTPFSFRSPATVRNQRYTAKFDVDYQVMKDLSVGLGYTLESYQLVDFMEETNTPWVEEINGNPNHTRDTSDSAQFGNRLVRLGGYLAPSYLAHVGTVSLSYRF